jgi:preprotein translocase subunit YajC
MIWNAANSIFALLAMGQPPGNGQQQMPWFMQYFPIFLIIFAFYFAILRPQQKRQKQHDQLLKNLQKNDRVTTTSGIVGTVVTVQDKSVTIRSSDAKLEVLKSAISEITERGGETNQPST